MRGGEAKDAGMAGATRIGTPDKVRQLQIALYRKAKAEPKYRFWSLYGELLRRDVLERGLGSAVEERRASGGGRRDALPPSTPARAVRQQWLDRLQEELKAKTYRPSPVRRVMIPKGSGGERPLGIPTVKDRVVQTAVSLMLMPIWEADFHPRSLRVSAQTPGAPGHCGNQQAVRRGYVEIIDADLSKYFDTHPAPGTDEGGGPAGQRRQRAAAPQELAARPDRGGRQGRHKTSASPTAAARRKAG